MGNLNKDELLKNFSGTDTPRWTKLVEKIDNNEKFTIDKKNIDTTLSYLDKNIENLFREGKLNEIATQYSGKPIFLGGNNQQYRLTQLYKSPEFGGGKGSGAGAEMTDQFESGQCLYASIVWNRKKPFDMKKKEILREEYNKQVPNIDTTADMERMLDMTDEWHTSSMLGANLLWEKLGKNGKKYKFHRGSSYVDKIEGTFKKHNQREKAFGNLNKWSPADIYMITPKGERLIDSELIKSKTLKSMNGLMLQYLLDGEVIGVSLKKMYEGSAHLKELNIDREKNKALQITGSYFQLVAQNKTSILDSMDIYLVHNKGKMQFRSFGGVSLTGWQGENKGTFAQQGKLALGPINFILKSHGCKEIPDHSVARDNANRPSKAYMTRFWDIVRKARGHLSPSMGSNKLPKTQEEFEQIWAVADGPWRYSKYLCFELIDSVAYKDKKIINDVMTDFFLYGQSMSTASSPYLKLTSDI